MRRKSGSRRTDRLDGLTLLGSPRGRRQVGLLDLDPDHPLAVKRGISAEIEAFLCPQNSRQDLPERRGQPMPALEIAGLRYRKARMSR